MDKRFNCYSKNLIAIYSRLDVINTPSLPCVHQGENTRIA